MHPIHLTILFKYIYCYNVRRRLKFVKYLLLQYFHLTLFSLPLSSLSCEFFRNPLFYSEHAIALTFLPVILQELIDEIPIHLKTVILISLL